MMTSTSYHSAEDESPSVRVRERARNSHRSAAGEDSTIARDMHAISGPTDSCIAFGPFQLFPVQRLLTKAGKPVQIGSRAFDILVALVERPGDLISKKELIVRAWPSTFVQQANLAVQIAALRRALDEDRRGNRYVVNIPGRGYQFVAPVAFHKDVPAEPTFAPPRRLGTQHVHSVVPATGPRPPLARSMRTCSSTRTLRSSRGISAA